MTTKGYAILAWDNLNDPGARNGLIFATEAAARLYAADLMCRWLGCKKTEVIEVDEAPTLELSTVRRFEEIASHPDNG